MKIYDMLLSASADDVEFHFDGLGSLPWLNFWLNPRRLRGSDFLMRWSQGAWSEKRLMDAVNDTEKYFAMPYGPSGTAPKDDIRAHELYFERLEKAGLGKIKRPDLLVFRKTDQEMITRTVKKIGGIPELPFIAENELKELLAKAVVAVESENSLWKSKRMPDYATPLSAQRRLKGKLGFKKAAVLPTIIVKEEDRIPLKKWQTRNRVPIHIWHVFYDQAFGISLKDVERVIKKGLIEPTVQTFQAPGGATTKKTIYKIYYHYGYPLGEITIEPSLLPAYIEDKNGHILPYVKFNGGKLRMRKNVLKILDSLTVK